MKIREAVRAILLTPQREVLLFRLRALNGRPDFWITPGGGIKTGETPEAALRRELVEELRLEAGEIGPEVWRLQHTFPWGERRLCQRNRYFIVPTERFAPCMHDAVEGDYLVEMRWWATRDIAHDQPNLNPRSLPDIVARYIAEGPPAELPPLEIIED